MRWRTAFTRGIGLLALLLGGATGTASVTRDIALTDGALSSRELARAIGPSFGLPTIAFPDRTLTLHGQAGLRFCQQLDETLSPGCHARIDDRRLSITLDETLPTLSPSRCGRLGRLLVSGNATRPAGRYGLTLPERYDSTRPLVVLVHGLDSDSVMWGTMVNLLQARGQQVAYFNYPNDGPIAGAADLLADSLADRRLAYPGGRPVSFVAHSMGGLVVRQYVEGVDYRGDVDRLIMLGTPNQGSTWTGWRWATEWISQYKTCQREGHWQWSDLSTDGNGEAAGDLKPHSRFLKQLNANPRRSGVRYTIVAGDRNAIRQTGADWLDCTASTFPARAGNWWGVRQTRACLNNEARELRDVSSDCDGPVRLKSCRLDGVDDFVVVHADHTSLACGDPPAGWDVIRDRLGLNP